jgi:hypothetical protein
MRRKAVSSSTLASVGYAAGAKTLEIEFLSGRIYLYLDVDREPYDALLLAPSLRIFFNAHLRDDYLLVCVV